jgi:hypothetical protein
MAEARALCVCQEFMIIEVESREGKKSKKNYMCFRLLNRLMQYAD